MRQVVYNGGMSTEVARFTIRLPADLFADVGALAARGDRPVNKEFIRWLEVAREADRRGLFEELLAADRARQAPPPPK